MGEGHVSAGRERLMTRLPHAVILSFLSALPAELSRQTVSESNQNSLSFSIHLLLRILACMLKPEENIKGTRIPWGRLALRVGANRYNTKQGESSSAFPYLPNRSLIHAFAPLGISSVAQDTAQNDNNNTH